eukprot:jgi/Orpsp1_1/1187672/evm.model.d7180000059344.1
MKFILDTYDKDHSHLNRYDINYNLTTFLFNEYDLLYNLVNIKYAIICNEEDIDKNENEKTTILFWNISIYEIFLSSSIYLNAFPLWYYQQKENGHTLCMKIDSVGWYDNTYSKICDEKDKSQPCPDFIILSTSQLTYRYSNGDIINLNEYFNKYHKRTGNSFESLLTKYSYYDYNVDNNWLGVPLSADFRILKFNKTTFDYCNDKGFELEYPPWTWEKVFEYAKKITECTGYPGLKIVNNYDEDIKFFISFCQSLNIPFMIEGTEYNIKKCGLRNKESINKLSILKDLVENHYINMWLNNSVIEDWINNEYPDSIDNLPKIPNNETTIMNEDSVNGLYYTTLYDFYFPGSSYFGGTGISITEKTKFNKDELFKFIEILIDKNYPILSELNISITPFDNIYGRRCTNTKTVKKERCNSLLRSNISSPFYYIKNNITNIIYLKHISFESDRGVEIDENNIKNINNNVLNTSPWADNIRNNKKKFKCSNQVDYEKNTISFYDEYEIEYPINDKETIILKSMLDIDTKNTEQTNDIKCIIYNEAYKNAKPLEVIINI